MSPGAFGAAMHGSGPHSTYGSFDTRSVGWTGPLPLENPEVVRRHLVQQSHLSAAHRHEGGLDDFGQDSSSATPNDGIAPGLDEDEFSSLRLQGGDITREVYRWTEEAEAQSRGRGRAQRSKSFHVSRPEPESDILDINNIKIPGGFRRNYLRRAADEHSPASPAPGKANDGTSSGIQQNLRPQPLLLTNNFIEFLSLYGHFAGEELEEDDEVLLPDEYFSSDIYDEGMTTSFGGEDEESREPGEDSALLEPETPGKRKRRRKSRGGSGKNGPMGAVLLLLKSFVGTGVLFLPKAYKNGGMLFSNLVLLGIAALSYYCFVLLVKTRMKVEGSFGDIGGILYGPRMRAIILFSIVLSQIGFASAYIVFTSENLQAFILAASDCRTWIDIKFLILMQLIVFLPLSLIRDISKLGATALIADGLILLGLVYLYYYDIFTIVRQGGVSDIVDFNSKDWTLFIGTAIFTFEGIGLIIPIQESMKKQEKFPPVLGGVMVIITIVFLSMGALGYAAYGSSTKTVVILNLPQDDKFVNGVQFFYSLAILLSTPLQLFPAIRITENALFTRSGKYNPYIKWQKNAYRFFLVMMTAGIAWFGANDLDKFVALVGSFACVPLVYMYPVRILTFFPQITLLFING
jgi:proton-coupled amino acid transporter